MSPPPLSAFAETLRENDEQFYNTFPAAKLAALYAPHTLYTDSSFVFYPSQQPIDGAYIQVDPQVAHFSPDQLNYDYPSVSPQHYQSTYEDNHSHSQPPRTYAFSPQPTSPYATQPIQEPAGSASPQTAHYVSSPSSLYAPPDTPPEVAAREDAHPMPIQSPVTVPSNAYVGPVRSHSIGTPYSTAEYDPQSLARPPRPSRPRHHDSAPYPVYTYQQIPPPPPRHARSLSQSGTSAPQRLPVRALSASASPHMWMETQAGVGMVGKGPIHHGSANVEAYPRTTMNSMRLSPLPSSKRPLEKKPPLACLFCRGRKIACGPPMPGSRDKTCNQCQRRQLECEYPAESRRGMRKKKTDDAPDGKTTSAPSTLVPVGKTLA